MNKHGVIVGLLALVLSFGLVAQEAAKPVELNVVYLTFGPIPADLATVQDELSKYTAAKIGATVKLSPINIGAFGQQTNLMLASGEKLDLMIDGTLQIFAFGTQVAKNQLLPLDDLLAKYGQGVLKAMEPVILKSGKVAGKQYIVPTVRDFAANQVIVMRKDIVDELKIDITKIKTLDDIEKVLMQVKKAKPDLIPLLPQSAGTGFLDGFQNWDKLGNWYGSLMDFGKDLKLVNLYETPTYAAHLKRIRAWYQAGLILPDAATNKDDSSVYIKANKGFAYLASGKPGFDLQESGKCGTAMVTAEFLPAFTSTDNALKFGWVVPRNSTNPEKAVQLMNLMYSDPVFFNTWVFGIEGKHWSKTASNQVQLPEGVNPGNAAYHNGPISWQLGNQFLAYTMAGSDPNIYKAVDTFNKGAKKSKALGFVFEVAPVKNEVAALQNVLNTYRLGLETGVLDPAKSLPEFQAKLKSAGIEKVIAEKQKQLNAWAAANGIK